MFGAATIMIHRAVFTKIDDLSVLISSIWVGPVSTFSLRYIQMTHCANYIVHFKWDVSASRGHWSGHSRACLTKPHIYLHTLRGQVILR